MFTAYACHAACGLDPFFGHGIKQLSPLQVVVLLAQIQLHMLSQQRAATLELLTTCTSLFKQQAQQGQPQSQLLWSQLQLHFCILRVLVMLAEGRYVELIASGSCHTSAPAMCRALCNQSRHEKAASQVLLFKVV